MSNTEDGSVRHQAARAGGSSRFDARVTRVARVSMCRKMTHVSHVLHSDPCLLGNPRPGPSRGMFGVFSLYVVPSSLPRCSYR